MLRMASCINDDNRRILASEILKNLRELLMIHTFEKVSAQQAAGVG